jgi:salicylate hydroxylase
MYGGPGAHVLHFPVAAQKLMNVVAFVDDPEEWPLDKPMTQPARKDELQGAFREWGPTVRAIVEMLTESQGLDKWAVFDMYDFPAERYADGRVCLAGDAAHASAPHHGAGAGIGVEDALALCVVLERVVGEMSRGKGKAEVLERALKVYSDVRLERSQWLVRSSREVCDVYEWVSECGRNMDKGFEDVKARSHKIWYFDIDEMIAQLNRGLDGMTESS